jgi:hypothetical protein
MGGNRLLICSAKGGRMNNFVKVVACLLLLISMQNLKAADLFSGLKVYLPFDNSITNVVNPLYNPNLSLSSGYEAGKINEAIKLNNNAYLSFRDSTNTLFNSKGFTWMTWIKLSDFSSTSTNGYYKSIISAFDSILTEDIYLGFGDLINEPQYLVFRVDGTTGVAGYMQPTAKYMPNGGFQNDTWYHIAGVCDYTNKKAYLFVNGILVDSANTRGTPINRNLNFNIGARTEKPNNSDLYLNGDFDDLRIYDRPLKKEDVVYASKLRTNPLVVDTNFIEFGNIECAADKSLKLKVKNLSPEPFTFKPRVQKNNNFIVSNDSITLASDDSIDVIIRYATLDVRDDYDTLFLENTSNVIPTLIKLNGRKFIDLSIKEELNGGLIYYCNDNLNVPIGDIINNKSNSVLKISEIKHNSNYSIKVTDSTIASKSIVNIQYSFSPNKPGKYLDTITIVFGNCSLEKKVVIAWTVYSVDAKLDSVVNFQNVIVGKPSSTFALLRNEADTTIKVTDASFILNKFNLDANAIRKDLEKDSILIIPISYNLPQEGLVIDTLQVLYSTSCGILVRKAVVSADAKYEAQFTLSSVSLLADTTLNTDDNIRIPFYISGGKFLKQSGIDSLMVTYTVNPFILTSNEKKQDSTINKRAYYTEYFRVDNSQTQQKFLSREFKVNLGDSDRDSVNIVELKSLNSFLDAKISSKPIVVGNICNAGGQRFIKITNTFNLNSYISKDKLNIDYELIEDGFYSIELINIADRKEITLLAKDLKRGIYNQAIDLKEISSGAYLIVMRTPTQIYTNKIFVGQ